MYTPEQVYQEVGTAVPFSKWCKSHCIKADESLSETDRVMLIFSSRNTKAKEELAADIKIRAALKVLEGFTLSSYTDKLGRKQREYLLREEAALQIAVKHGSGIGAVLIQGFLDAKDSYIKHLEAPLLGDTTLRPIPRKIYVMWDPVKKQCRIGRSKTFVEHLYLVWESMLTTNAAEIEASIHKHFEDKHVHGEWFAVSPEEAFDYINTLDFGRVLMS